MNKKPSFNQVLHRLNNRDVLGEKTTVKPPVDISAEVQDEVEDTTKNLAEEVEDVEEGLRLISTHTNGNKTAKVYKDSEWGEHRVKLHIDGKHQKNADYHTDDKEDAVGTAKKMIESEEFVAELSNRVLHNYTKKAKDNMEDKRGNVTKRFKAVIKAQNKMQDRRNKGVKEEVEQVDESDKEDAPGHVNNAKKNKRADRFATKKKFKTMKEEAGMEAPAQASPVDHGSSYEADDHYHAAQSAHHRFFNQHSADAKNPIDAVLYHANMAKHHEQMAKVSAGKGQEGVAKAHLKARGRFLGHMQNYAKKA